jgi:CheY-like chemotaxis protein
MANCDNYVYSKARIFLVDDDKSGRNAVYSPLEGDGYLARAAPDGSKACRFFVARCGPLTGC